MGVWMIIWCLGNGTSVLCLHFRSVTGYDVSSLSVKCCSQFCFHAYKILAQFSSRLLVHTSYILYIHARARIGTHTNAHIQMHTYKCTKELTI